MSGDFRMRANGAGMGADSHRRDRGLLFGSRDGPGGVGASSKSAGAMQEQEHIEAQNQQRVDNLGNKVGTLKSVAITIGGEVDYQNQMLDKMGNQFDDTTDVLGQTMKSLDEMVKSGKVNSMCYLALGLTIVMLLAYFLLRKK
uniref:t-SNARE coiled-coil homology domain-containing protein n=1 Tax=Rhodosorus marinus TaxID=101924 RepID=A0A7S0BK76_9RHOD|mmetsp:Transcript_19259/g.27913  ORF Transcript_19259/g.27913 Transcript_19259/m.27913 type:complete len:143 (+) Transcript_19259:224-652(+)